MASESLELLFDQRENFPQKLFFRGRKDGKKDMCDTEQVVNEKTEREKNPDVQVVLH